MKALGIVPARYKSSRFPGKPLVNILGIPLVVRVAQIVEAALGHENTVIATDCDQIKAVAQEFGFQVAMTSSDAMTGTDRLWEVAQEMPADIYLNIQGDEPMVKPEDIRRVFERKKEAYNTIINGYAPIGDSEDPACVNIPKVIFNEQNQLVYMSRNLIPGFKDVSNAPKKYYRQVCIYGYNYQELESFGTFGRKSALEFHEDIEILRFFELGIPIVMCELSGQALAVDVPSDVAKVEDALMAQQVADPNIKY